jgi:hypothetical protein
VLPRIKRERVLERVLERVPTCAVARERGPDMRRIYSASGLLRHFKERVGRILSASELPVKSGT